MSSAISLLRTPLGELVFAAAFLGAALLAFARFCLGC